MRRMAIQLPHIEQGDSTGIPVILLHGYSDSHRSYEPLLAHLPRDLRATALTTRGHGDAPRPHGENAYTPATLADDVVAHLDDRDIEAAVIVGHSAGSYTAQQLAVDHPDRVRGLVLMGAFRSTRENPAIAPLLAAVDELTDPVDPEFVREFQLSTLAQPVPPAFLDMVCRESRKLPARVWQQVLRELVDAPVPTETATIEAPTLVLWGDRDDICLLDEQARLAAAIPGSELVAQSGLGHALHWEQPHRAAADIAAFARRAVSPRAPRRPRSAAAR